MSDTTRPIRRMIRPTGAALAVGTAIGATIVQLRRRSRRSGVAPAPSGRSIPPEGARPDDRPDLVHAPGHQHRLRGEPSWSAPVAADHPAAPPLRHRDRGGRSTAFHTRRGA